MSIFNPKVRTAVILITFTFWLSLRALASATLPLLPDVPFQISQETLLDRQVDEQVEKRSCNSRHYNIKSRYEVVDANSLASSVIEREERIVEVGSGICYQDATGQWQVSRIEWQQTKDGFVIDEASYTLKVANTLDVWMEYTANGKKAKLRPVKIQYSDTEQSEDLFSVNLQSQGMINPEDPTRLIFPDAFGEGIDLEVQAKLSGYHQNVIFHQHPLEATNLSKKGQGDISVVTEVSLGEIGDSIELSTEKEYSETLSSLSEFRAEKKHLHLFIRDTKDLSRESTEWFSFADSKVFDKRGIKENATSARKELKRDKDGALYLVESLENGYFDSAEYPVVWDYQTVGGNLELDKRFWYAINTYYVSSDLYVGNTALLIEPGTVVKFNDDTRIEAGYYPGYSGLIAVGEPLLPIVFTSKHDNTCGSTITGSTGIPARGDYEGLYITDGSDYQEDSLQYALPVSDKSIEFCRIQYAQHGLHIENCSFDILHNIISECQTGVYTSSGSRLIIANNLIVNCDNGLYADVDSASPDWFIYNCTLDNHTYVALSTSNLGDFTLKNCLITNCVIGVHSYSLTNITGGHCAYYENTQDFSGPFSGGTGDIYLFAPNSPYEDNLTFLGRHYLNRDSDGGGRLLDSGYGVMGWFSHYRSGSSSWSVHHVSEERCFSPGSVIESGDWEPGYDSGDTGTLAIGYHHPRIDYYLEPTCSVESAGTLVVQPGTTAVVKGATGGSAISFGQGAQLLCRGCQSEDGTIDYVRWLNRNRASALVANQLSGTTSYATDIEMMAGSAYDIQFTKFEGANLGLSIQGAAGICRNSEFNLNVTGVALQFASGSKLENCLFKNNTSGVYLIYSSDTAIEFCTFLNNPTGIQVYNGSDIVIQNNLFHYYRTYLERGIFIASGSPDGINESYNAFYNYYYPYSSSSYSLGLNPNDLTNTGGAIDIGGDPLVSRSTYYPSFFSQRYCLSSTTPLVNGGYDPDTAGMPAFSTQTNNSPDTGQVDIGYHTPLPIDTDGDGFYDYAELWQGTNPYGATIWYVKATAADGGNGLSWDTAFNYLQDAFTNELLVSGDEIWVAGGTYYPDEGQKQDDNERSSTFELIEGVSLYGGFAGMEISLGQRNWTGNETILSGDIDKDDFGDAENCYHVVTGADNAVLDGFTIIGGYADGESNDEHGGGMLNFGTSPIIRHCMFKYNAALYGGGAIANIASPVIPQPFFQNCLVVNNQAANFGGGVYSHFSMPMVVNCTFSGNQAQYGGAIFEDCSSGWVVDSILWGDDATSGSEVAIFTPDDIDCYSTFYYNDVQGDIAGVIGAGGYASVDWQENLNMDPLYANAASGDFHLKSTVGRWTPGGWVTDSVTSPCINAGDPMSVRDNEPSPNGDRVNMGVYGNTAQASKSGMPITVIITPAEAVTAGAKWAVLGYDTVWRDSGAAAYFSPGDYTIVFKPAGYGWMRPDDLEITVNADQSFTESIEYKGVKYVDRTYAGTSTGSFTQPYKSITNGLIGIGNGEVLIIMAAGTYNVSSITFPTGKEYRVAGQTYGSNDPYQMIASTTEPVVLVQGNQTGSVFVLAGVQDGVTIENLQINNGKAIYGGGIYLYNSSPEILNCEIIGNLAYSNDSYIAAKGGGIYIEGGVPKVYNCVFDGNVVLATNWKCHGGGLYIRDSLGAIVEGCLFVGNEAHGQTSLNRSLGYAYAGTGGAIHVTCSDTEFINCDIGSVQHYPNINRGDEWGDMGSVEDTQIFYLSAPIPTFTNCLTYGQEFSGSIYSFPDSK